LAEREIKNKFLETPKGTKNTKNRIKDRLIIKLKAGKKRGKNDKKTQKMTGF